MRPDLAGCAIVSLKYTRKSDRAKMGEELKNTIIFCLPFIISSWCYAKINVRIDPLAALGGALNVGIDHDIGSSSIFGFSFGSLNYSAKAAFGDEDNKLEATINAPYLGVRAAYAFSGAFSSSWFLGVMARYYPRISFKTKDLPEREEIGAGGFWGVDFGYQWFWQHFNIMLGYLLSFCPSKIDAQDEQSNVTTKESFPCGGGIEFTLGWVF